MSEEPKAAPLTPIPGRGTLLRSPLPPLHPAQGLHPSHCGLHLPMSSSRVTRSDES